MNTPRPDENTLGLLRELPPEVSLQQVGLMVAAFPLVATPASWLAQLQLKTIAMTTTGTIVVGSAIYLLSADPTTAGSATTAEAMPTVIELEEAPAVLEAPAVVFEMPKAKAAPAAAKPVVAEVVVVDVQPLPATPPPAKPDAPVNAAAPAAPKREPAEKPGAPCGERVFDLKGFTGIALHGHLEVVVEQGDFLVMATGESAALDRLHLEVGDGTLMIGAAGPAQNKNNCRSVTDTKLVVRLPDLARVDVYGSGTVNMGDHHRTGGMVLNLQGSGDLLFTNITGLSGLTINLTGSGDVVGSGAEVAGLTKVLLTGSGEVHIAGRTKDIDLSLVGSGDLDARALDAESGRVSVQGSGDAFVSCSGPLERNVSGSGEIHLSRDASSTRPRGVGIDMH